MMKVAVYGLKADASQIELFHSFFQEITSRNFELLIEKKFLTILESLLHTDFEGIQSFENYHDLPKDIDYFFTFGGDGTILNAATIIQDKNIPVVGINTGRLGFLATINIDSLQESLDRILEGNYTISKRSLIHVDSKEENFEFPFALNEIAVNRRETTSMITVETYMNGEFLNAFWADGLIVSTPTGSTGYSLSCGGPIVHPDNHTFVITPIAPHNLNVRPFIISDDCELDLKIISRTNEFFLSLDARNKPLSTNVQLKLKKATFTIQIVEPHDKTYLITLREKMFWGSDKRN